MSLTTQEAQATADADSQSRAMFVARLEDMQKNGNLWITVPAVLMLLNDCDMLASITMDVACEGCGGTATHDVGADLTSLPGAYCNDCDPSKVQAKCPGHSDGRHRFDHMGGCYGDGCNAYDKAADLESASTAVRPVAHNLPQPAVPVVSEDDLVACLISSGCVGTVKMSFESGPMSITRPSLNATKFARAILALRPQAVPMTPEQRDAEYKKMLPSTDAWLGEDFYHQGIIDAEAHHGITAKAEGGA